MTYIPKTGTKPTHWLSDWQRKESLPAREYCQIRAKEEGLKGKTKEVFLRSCIKEADACKAFVRSLFID